MKIMDFHELDSSDLVIDAIYEGGTNKNSADDPITKIISVGNQGGFRRKGSIDSLKYIVLYSSGENLDWPDSLDTETGIFKYYGDNKKPGHTLYDTKNKGNLILKNIFDSLHNDKKPRQNIPPIFIFEKHPTLLSKRSVQFRGLCVPGTLQRSSTEDLVAIWKTTDGQRFQNYVAYFTVLDVALISRDWINDLKEGNLKTENTPKEFIKWLEKGKYTPLMSKKTISIRTVEEQLPQNKVEEKLLDTIFKYFKNDPNSFEYFAAEIYRMSNTNIIIDEITRGVIDGGRDAIGRMKLGLENDPIFIDFALEAKCYNPGMDGEKRNTVGVKETSRLISRIKNRQYGVLVTTSVIAKQAYEEIREDGHPIVFISGSDIVKILIEKGFNTEQSLMQYLKTNYQL